MTDASHLSSISRMVASGVDFFTGMDAAGDELLAGLGLLLGSGEEDLGAAGELTDFGAGVADFSVVTETLGSEGEVSVFSEADASGDAAGVDSSWARANGAPAITTAVMARRANFICFVLLCGFGQRARVKADGCIAWEDEPYWATRCSVKAHLAAAPLIRRFWAQDPLASIVLIPT